MAAWNNVVTLDNKSRVTTNLILRLATLRLSLILIGDNIQETILIGNNQSFPFKPSKASVHHIRRWTANCGPWCIRQYISTEVVPYCLGQSSGLPKAFKINTHPS